MEKLDMVKCFTHVKTTRAYSGYIYSVGRALTIVILGALCGLSKIEETHQWAKSPQVKLFLATNFGIHSIPSCRWLAEIISIIDPKSLNDYFMRWVETKLPECIDDLTIAFDGKTIRSTGKMGEHEKPIHILSAYLTEHGLVLGQKTVDEKSNEIPAMRELLKLINISGSVVVADALHCQTETAEAIITNGGDYLLNVKGNQETLEKDIEDYVQDSELQKQMETETTKEKNGGRYEVRQSFVSNDISWMGSHLTKWRGLACFGAINRRFTVKGTTSNEWHYYISSRELTAAELLKYARNEWAIESMHWLLDVHFDEDSCKLRDINSIQNMNMISKMALNQLRIHKNESGSKLPLSRLMFACLLDCNALLNVVNR